MSLTVSVGKDSIRLYVRHFTPKALFKLERQDVLKLTYYIGLGDDYKATSAERVIDSLVRPPQVLHNYIDVEFNRFKSGRK